MDNREEIIRLGVGARALLKDDTLNYVFDSVLHEQFALFMSTEPLQSDEREKIWATMQSMDLVRRKLEALVQSGNMEERNKAHDEQS